MTREEFLNDLRPLLRRSAAWRTKLTERFPGDRRNERAAESLEVLAQAAPADIGASTWSRLESRLQPGYRTAQWADNVSEAAKLVGFKSFPETLDAFLTALLARAVPGGAA